MATKIEYETAGDKPHDVVRHRSMYEGMMNFGFSAGLPIGGAIAMFCGLLLIGVNLLVAFFLSVLGWLGLLGVAKTFFIHRH